MQQVTSLENLQFCLTDADMASVQFNSLSNKCQCDFSQFLCNSQIQYVKTSRFWCGGRLFRRHFSFYRTEAVTVRVHYSPHSYRNESRKPHENISSLRSVDAIRDSSDLRMSRLMIAYYTGDCTFAYLLCGAM